MKAAIRAQSRKRVASYRIGRVNRFGSSRRPCDRPRGARETHLPTGRSDYWRGAGFLAHYALSWVKESWDDLLLISGGRARLDARARILRHKKTVAKLKMFWPRRKSRRYSSGASKEASERWLIQVG